MEELIQFGLGFVTGRPNVCKVINSTYEHLIEQFKNTGKKVELTVFILFDLQYQYTTRVDFYGLIPKVYKDINSKRTINKTGNRIIFWTWTCKR